MLKKCGGCGVEKAQDDFYKDKRTPSGLFSRCIQCTTDRRRISSRSRLEAVCTKEMLLQSRWKSISTRKQIPPYVDVELRITRDEFLKLFDNSELATLFEAWDKAGRPRYLAPSIDRIDPLGHYSADNMRWLTVSENTRRARKGRRKTVKNIIQLTRTGEELNRFTTYADAAIAVSGSPVGASNILSCVKGRIPSAYNYYWKCVDNQASQIN